MQLRDAALAGYRVSAHKGVGRDLLDSDSNKSDYDWSHLLFLPLEYAQSVLHYCSLECFTSVQGEWIAHMQLKCTMNPPVSGCMYLLKLSHQSHMVVVVVWCTRASQPVFFGEICCFMHTKFIACFGTAGSWHLRTHHSPHHQTRKPWWRQCNNRWLSGKFSHWSLQSKLQGWVYCWKIG